MRSYKALTRVEHAFRTLKTTDLQIRPIHHRLVDRVRAHLLLCMLAYYVEWHMREAWRPLLFADEELAEQARKRDPVAAAAPSASAMGQQESRRTQFELDTQLSAEQARAIELVHTIAL